MAKGKGQRRHINVGEVRKPRPPISVPEPFKAFTMKANGLVNRIVNPVRVAPAFDPREYVRDGKPFPSNWIEKQALWDTGATGSVLTSATVKELNLVPIGIATVNHAGGTDTSNTYLVNFSLMNGVGIAGVTVTECDDAGGFGAIIGMDIITKGDFALTNKDGKTIVTFRIPSYASIDYVEEHRLLMLKYMKK